MKKREFTGNRRRISYTVQYLYDDKGTRYKKSLQKDLFMRRHTMTFIYLLEKGKKS